jgi:hypothetical protein
MRSGNSAITCKKGGDRINQLGKWIASHPGVDSETEHHAQSLMQDLISAMSGDGYPGEY